MAAAGDPPLMFAALMMASSEQSRSLPVRRALLTSFCAWNVIADFDRFVRCRRQCLVERFDEPVGNRLRHAPAQTRQTWRYLEFRQPSLLCGRDIRHGRVTFGTYDCICPGAALNLRTGYSLGRTCNRLAAERHSWRAQYH